MKDGYKDEIECRFQIKHVHNQIREVVEDDEHVDSNKMRVYEFGTIKLAVAHEWNFNFYNL